MIGHSVRSMFGALIRCKAHKENGIGKIGDWIAYFYVNTTFGGAVEHVLLVTMYLCSLTSWECAFPAILASEGLSGKFSTNNIDFIIPT